MELHKKQSCVSSIYKMPDLKPTVMPKDDKPQVQNNYLGGPGIHIPSHPENIEAFQKYEKTDVNELNARIEAEEAVKALGGSNLAAQSATPGIQIPHNAEDIPELGK